MVYVDGQAVIAIISHLIFIVLTFWAMQSLLTSGWIKKHHIPQARLLFMLISIAIGYNVSLFVLEIIFTAQSIGALL